MLPYRQFCFSTKEQRRNPSYSASSTDTDCPYTISQTQQKTLNKLKHLKWSCIATQHLGEKKHISYHSNPPRRSQATQLLIKWSSLYQDIVQQHSKPSLRMCDKSTKLMLLQMGTRQLNSIFFKGMQQGTLCWRQTHL